MTSVCETVLKVLKKGLKTVTFVAYEKLNKSLKIFTFFYCHIPRPKGK